MARAEVDEVRRRVHAMQAELAPAVSRCRLLTRESAASDPETWMEIYEDVRPVFEDALAAAVLRHAIADRIGERHVERFVASAGS